MKNLTATARNTLAVSPLNSLRNCVTTDTAAAELKWLARDITKVGQLVPIVRKGEEIIDGLRRLEACKIAGISPKFVDISELGIGGTGELTLAIWDSLNGEGRRHLSLNQRALIAVQMAQGQTVGSNQHTKDANGPSMSQKDASKTTAVSVDTMQRLQKLHKLADKANRRGEIDERVKNDTSISQLLRELEAHEIYQKVNSKASKAAIQKSAQDFTKMIRANLQYSVVYADPPWDYGHKTSTATGSPHGQYPLMSLQAIMDMDVKSLAAKDSVCWLWVPNCLIKDGIEVLKAWGFEFVTTMVWLKNKSPISPGAIRPFHETILIGKRGSGLGKDNAIKSTAYFEPVGQHSQKPAYFAKLIDQLYLKVGKIELFARTPRKGWAVWGNQSNGNAIKVTAKAVVPKPLVKKAKKIAPSKATAVKKVPSAKK